MNTCKIKKLNHITVAYGEIVESVMLMVQEHYDTPEYDETFFFINDLPIMNFQPNNYKKRIYYLLEHKSDYEDKLPTLPNSDVCYLDFMQNTALTKFGQWITNQKNL